MSYNYARFQEEDDEKTVKGTVTITFEFEASFPKKWGQDDINEYIENNIDQFACGICDIEDISWRII